jgi:thymidylate kinase
MRLHPEDEFWVTLLHCLLDKQALSERHQERLRALAVAATPNGPLFRFLQRLGPSAWSPERLIACVRQNSVGELLAMVPALRASWARQPATPSHCETRIDELMKLPGRILHRLHHPGVTVAILGPDGAGKSTLAESIRRSFFTPVRVIYMGFGISGGQSQPPLLARLRVPGVGAPGRLFVLWWQFVKAFAHQSLGRLVLFDRYTYDALAPPPVRRSWPRRLSSWVKARACPEPDLILVLDAPGETMYRRKGDLSPEVLEAQRQRFLALQSRMTSVRVLDATLPEAAVRSTALAHLWTLYLARWRR